MGAGKDFLSLMYTCVHVCVHACRPIFVHGICGCMYMFTLDSLLTVVMNDHAHVTYQVELAEGKRCAAEADCGSGHTTATITQCMTYSISLVLYRVFSPLYRCHQCAAKNLVKPFLYSNWLYIIMSIMLCDHIANPLKILEQMTRIHGYQRNNRLSFSNFDWCISNFHRTRWCEV